MPAPCRVVRPCGGPRIIGRAALVALAFAQTGCDAGTGRGAAAAANAPMTPSGLPLEHMDTSRAMTTMAQDTLAEMCAVSAGGAAPRVTLVADAAGAARPARVVVEVVPASRAGVGAELLVGGRVRASCAGGDLMIAGPGVSATGARLRLTTGGPVIVLARTGEGRALAGPVRIAPGAPGAVLAWGDRRP